MSIGGLDFQPVHLPLAAGLNQKVDARALQPPELARCVDVQFDEVGGLQTRYPYALTTLATTDGGTVTDPRRIVENGSELLLFSKDSLYSWHALLSKWALRGTHLAVKLEEAPRFVTGGEQIDCDRAELDGLVVYAWTEGTTVYASAIDSDGSVVVAPTNMTGSDTASRPRLVALDTKILMLVSNATTGWVEAIAIDPADPTGTLVSGNWTQFGVATHNAYYDATRVVGADQAVMVQRLNPTTSYQITTINADLTGSTAAKARACSGPIAVSCAPNGTHVQVVRHDGAITGDYIAIAGFVDVYTAQAIGTCSGIVDGTQLTAAHRSVQDGGQYRCYVFWSDNRSSDGVTDWVSRSNWVDTGNALGVEETFLRRLDVGSRAFDHDGRVFVWMLWAGAAGAYGWGGQLQNASYLYRDDGFLVAKSAMNRGGGLLTTGHLPGVANTSGNTYAYCGTERVVFGELTSGNFTGRRPRDVAFTFDSNEARRCVRLGETLYITGGEILQYDGTQLVEVGFHVWPWYFELVQTGGGNLADGTYAYKLAYRSDNGRADRDRSASVRIEEITVAAGPKQVDVQNIVPLYVTHKATLACEVWRTKVNPPDEAPTYLASTSDPSDLTNPNRHLPNDTTAGFLPTMEDVLADADLEELGQHPQDVELEHLAPPAATLIAASTDRLFLAGVAGDPDRVWYSKRRTAGQVAAFHDVLVADVPPGGGSITALAFLNESPVVFRETAIFVLLNDGLDNTGAGQNFVARAVPGDVGAVNQESVAATERGLVFKSSKGWYLLNRAYALEYIGAAVSDYDNETPLAVHAVESQHQIRILTSARMIVVDTLLETWRWGEWSISDGVHACMWNGSHVYLSATGPKVQQTSYVGVDYGMDIETSWIKLADLQGFGCVDQLQILGEYRSAHTLQVRLARDYWKDGVDTYFQSKPHTPSGLVAGQPLRLKHGPSIRQMQALKVRLTASPTAAGESLKLTGLSLELGMRRGLNRHLPTAQKQ